MIQKYHAGIGFFVPPLVSPADKTWQNSYKTYNVIYLFFFHYLQIILEEKKLLLHYGKMRHWDEADMTNLIYLLESKFFINTVVKANVSLNKWSIKEVIGL